MDMLLSILSPLDLHTSDVTKWFSFVIVLIAVQFLVRKWIKRREYVTQLMKLGGPVPRFLTGNLGGVREIYRKKTHLPQPVYIFERITGTTVLFEKQGMYLMWFGFQPIVTAYRADIFESILSSSVSLDKSWEYRFLHPWLGLGLLTSTGSKWLKRRRILTPSFHFRILEDFLPVFNEQSLILVKKFQGLAEKDWVDIVPLVILCTLDIVMESVMGTHMGAQENSDSDYVQAVHSLGDYFNRRSVRPWLWPDILFYSTQEGKKFKDDVRILHNFTRQVIKERKEAMLLSASKKDLEEEKGDTDTYTSGRKRKAFMDLLLDLHIKDQLLSEEDIREEVDTFMFEGHDTTAMGISWALYCIGLYPDVQKKIAEELASIFADDQERPISHDDVRQMKYLECALKESQRIYPSVPLIGRLLNEDVTIGGATIPKNTMVHLSIVALHKNSEMFPNPEVFDPDRFLPENTVNRHPYAFVPFSAGPRNCIGQKFAMMEEKVVISNILRHFEIVSLDPRDKVHPKVEFVLRPAQALRLKFIRRNL